MTPDDRKTAVSHWVTLSSQVIAATLALIAVEGAFATFVLGNRLPSLWFYILVILTFLLFILSILSGGAGISKMTTEGSKGNWSLDVGQPYFQRQTFICLLGVFLFFMSLFLGGPSKNESETKKWEVVQEQLRTQGSQLSSALAELKQLRADLNTHEEQLNKLKAQLEKCQQHRPRKQH